MSLFDSFSLNRAKKSGDSNYDNGKFNEALRDYDQVLSIDPENAYGLYMKSEISFMKGRFSEATEAHDRVLKMEKIVIGAPSGNDFWLKKGKDLYGNRKYLEASVCFNRIIIEDSQSAEAWFHKGLALKSAGYQIRSLECFDKAIEILEHSEEEYIKKVKQNDTRKNRGDMVRAMELLAATREIRNRIKNGIWSL